MKPTRAWGLTGALAALALAGCAGQPVSEPTGSDAATRFESPLLFPGNAWNFTFPAAFHQDYHCDPHPWMQGMVHVEERTTGQPMRHRVTIYENANGTWGFNPTNVTIQAGDTVEWVNEGREPHTVTRIMGHNTHDMDR